MRFGRKQKTDESAPRRRLGGSSTPEAEKFESQSFRRNRTLTGSLSSQVVSTNESKAELRSPRVHAHHLALQRRKVINVLSVIILASLGLYLLIDQFTANATITLKAIPRQADSQKIYEPMIQDYLNQRPLERLRFMTSTDELTRFVQAEAPEVEKIEIASSATFATSSFTFSMRRAVTGWTIGGVQKYVDANGIPFSRNYYSTPAVEIVDKSGVPAINGQAVASNRFLSFVGKLVGLIKESGIEAEQVIIPIGTTREIDLKLKGVGYLVKCSVDRPVGEQAEDMNRAIRYLQERGMTPGYVDVRVSGKAYYK